jgi:hypothetical protein
MKKYLLSIATFLFAFAFSLNVSAQCINTTSYGTRTITYDPVCQSYVLPTPVGCHFGGEYSTWNGIVMGEEFTWSSTVATDYLTITDATSTTVYAFGVQPLTWVATIAGTVRVHINTDAACGSEFACRDLSISSSTLNTGAPSTCATAVPAGTTIQFGGSETIQGTTLCTSSQPVPTCTTTLNSAGGVWYSFTTSTCGGNLTVTTCGFDTKLGLFGGDCNNLICISGNDDTTDPACTPFGESLVSGVCDPNTTYYIYVTGFGSSTGNFDLTLNFSVDECCTADPLVAEFVPADFTVCPGEPFTGSLVITGGIQGPPNGFARAMVPTSGYNGAPANAVIRQNGDDGTVNMIETTLPAAAFRAGGAIIKENPADPPVLTDPMYYIESDRWFVYQNGVETLIAGGLPLQSTGNAWDPTTNQMYLCTAGYPGGLYTVNHLTGATSLVGNFSGGGVQGFAIWIVVDDATGDMYMLDLATSSIYQIDKTTAACTLVGYVGFAANFGQDAYWWDGKIYSSAFNANTFTCQYGYYDAGTGAFNLITDFGFAQLGAQAWVGQTFPGGYDIQWNMTTGLTETSANWETFDGLLTEPGLYEYEVTITDACGATATASMTVTVLNTPDALACNDHVTISVYDGCQAEIRADMFLEGPYEGCYDLMEVYIWPFGNENLATADLNNGFLQVTPAMLQGTHTFVVFNPLTGNTCWGTFNLEDKIVPSIDCGDDIIIECYEAIPYVQPTVYDNCSNWGLTYTDDVYNLGCGEFTTHIEREWTVTDFNNGMTNTCVQHIWLKVATLDNLAWPLNWNGLAGHNPMLECSNVYPLDQYGNPHPDYTGWPEGTLCSTIEVFYHDTNYTSDCGPKILREWTVVDDCTADIRVHTQIIRITDSTAPVLHAKGDMAVSTSAWSCDADYAVPAPEHFYDNCDANPQYYIEASSGIVYYDINSHQWYVFNLPIGVHTITYVGYDWCGNTVEDELLVTVFDGIPPIAVCEQFKQTSLTFDGVNSTAKIWAQSFDSGSHDAGCGPVWFKVKRNDDGCPEFNGDDNPGGSNDIWYDDYAKYCCEDVGVVGGIMTTLRVFDVDPGVGPVNPKRMELGGDLYGHYNDCWTMVTVEEKVPPQLICHDVTITCEENYDPALNPSVPYPSVFSTCGNYDLEYTIDNSGLSVCGIGTVKIKWTVSVNGEKKSTCTQIVTVEETYPFDPTTIVFPYITSKECLADPKGGDVEFETNPCNVVDAEIVNVDTFRFVDDACYKILIDWVVIDWCVYEPNTGAEDNVDQYVYFSSNKKARLAAGKFVEDGYYKFTEVLMVYDQTPANIVVEDYCLATATCVTPTETYEIEASSYEDDEDCGGIYSWWYVIHDMATWEVVQYSDNNLNYKGNNYQGGVSGKSSKDDLDGPDAKLTILPALGIGQYRVLWTLNDGCSNTTQAYQYIEVADKKAPTPFMVDIATALMSNGMVEMSARFFDKGACNDNCLASYDNCSDVLYFTFTPVLPLIDATWSLDAYGLFYFNPTTGAKSNRNNYLAGTAHSWNPVTNTSGKVFTCDDTPSQYVDIYVWDKFALNEDCDDGNYDFATVFLNLNDDGDCPGGLVQVAGMITANHNGEGINNVEVTIEKEGNAETKTTNTANGAYAFDVQTGNYSVAPEKRDDYSNGVTTLDLVLIQKHLLGLVPLTGDDLIAADANASSSVTAGDLFELRELILGVKSELAHNDSWVFVPGAQDITANTDVNVNFGGIKVGDVNGSAVANANSTSIESRNANTINLVADEASVEAGLVEVAFTAENFANVYGAQFTLNVNGMSYAGVEAGALNVTDNNFGLVRNGVITMSWNNANGTTVSDGTVLFTLKLQSTVNGTLSNLMNVSSDVTAAQAYTTENLDINNLDVTFRGAEVATFELYQNEPNPFTESTVIGFSLPEAANYTLTIFDVTGKVVKVVTNDGQKGYNSESIDRKDISSGVMYYQLESNDYTATKKMIIIE